jgi:hypothetical protein
MDTAVAGHASGSDSAADFIRLRKLMTAQAEYKNYRKPGIVVILRVGE